MVKKEHLSGEQALNDYFNALLDEELATEEPEEEVMITSVPVFTSEDVARTKSLHDEEVALQDKAATTKEVVTETETSGTLYTPPVPEAKPQSDYHIHTSYTERGYNEFDVPDLDDVQKLLDKISTTDLTDEPEIVTLIEQNTQEISRSAKAEIVEEIQEWEIEEVAEDIPEVTAEPEIIEETEVNTEPETQAGAINLTDWTSTERTEDFQVLYFDVNGVTFAVPLDELGGIHRKGEMSHLIGRPDWYLGLQTNKEDQLDVVDTAKWVMAERLKDDSHKEAYQYIVMLGLSNWGLASTELKGTEILNAGKVRWREQAGKRPWLAGMVKEKMCALIHVEALIAMLNAGLDVKSLDS